ncbi:hypothetical protein U0030_02670 [Brevundimonas bullata]|uniref:hypothetical protein n=1 Tax=Brevundimonas bullata TaxID=13160 RepID=UPI000E0BC39C|nr:hypothetical protein [Brevundimonas bullata]WQE37401.1 hypothetical protein U0030_02670 [Brevundimonas bullata]
MNYLTILAVATAATVGLAACSPSPSEPAASAAEAPAAAPVAPAPSQAAALPAVDMTAAKARVTPETTIEAVTLSSDGETTVTGEVRGYEAPAYVIPVAAGQTLKVTFKPGNTNLYMNVFDVADQGVAAHRGDVDGEEAVIQAQADGTYMIQPYQVRATARRGETGSYSIVISRTSR